MLYARGFGLCKLKQVAFGIIRCVGGRSRKRVVIVGCK